MDLVLTRPAQRSRQVGKRVSPSPRGPLTWFSAAEPRGSVAPAQGESASRTPGRTRFAAGPPWASRVVGQRPGSLHTRGRSNLASLDAGNGLQRSSAHLAALRPPSAGTRSWTPGRSVRAKRPTSRPPRGRGSELGARVSAPVTARGAQDVASCPAASLSQGSPAGIRGRERARRQGAEGDALISAGDAAWENGVAPARRAVPLLGRLLPEAGPEGGVCRGVRRGAAQVRSPRRPAEAVPGFGARTRGASPQQGELQLHPRLITHSVNEPREGRLSGEGVALRGAAGDPPEPGRARR